MEEKDSFLFYEGLYVVQTFWLMIAVLSILISVLLVVFAEISIIVPLVVIVVYLLTYKAINYFSKKSFRKIEISKKGIVITQKENNAFYAWEDTSFIELQSGKFINAFLTSEFLNWMLKMSYLDITLKSEYETISPILIRRKDKILLDKLDVKYF